MKLVSKLLNYLHDGFDKAADDIISLRVRHNTSDAFNWLISERRLILSDGTRTLDIVDLSFHTIATLTAHLRLNPDLTVVFSTNSSVSATSLIDGTGYQSVSNGDIMRSYQSLIWMYLDAISTELVEAKNRIFAMLDQMSIPSADDDWLDYWGDYFGIPRYISADFISEDDVTYANRIIYEVIRPRGNNKAIELFLLNTYGQAASVTDIVRWGDIDPAYNSLHIHDSSVYHNSAAVPLYGLFDISIGYDLLSSENPLSFVADVTRTVEKLRDAGTHLNSVVLESSQISDTHESAPVDDDTSLRITMLPLHDGYAFRDSTWRYGPVVSNEILYAERDDGRDGIIAL